MTRPVAAATVWSAVSTSLGRLACVYADPAADGHHHPDCLVDDVAYAADLTLGLVAAVCGGNDDAILARLDTLREAMGDQDAQPAT